MSTRATKPTVTILADDTSFSSEYAESIGNDFSLVKVKSEEEGRGLLLGGGIDVLLMGLSSDGENIEAGLALLRDLEKNEVDTVVIVLSDDATEETALRVMAAGAYDYLTRPVNPAVLNVIIGRASEKQRIKRENRLLRQEISRRKAVGDLLGSTEAMQDLFASIRRVARTNATVSIRGESGSGKELVARAIHDLSQRRDRAFVSVNCAALPDTLMESELFGYEKGAFTGAAATKEGRIELAHRGTLFLDEIGTLGVVLQSKLLRVIEDQTMVRLGGKRNIRVDFRLITATNEDLEKSVREGRFREDLYYRIHVVPLFVPPLRERTEDIPLLVDYFAKVFSAANQLPEKTVDDEAMNALKRYAWPGNVRELENLMHRLVVMLDEDVIGLRALPRDIRETAAPSGRRAQRLPVAGISLLDEVAAFEKNWLEIALKEADGVKVLAGQKLGLSKDQMKYLCRKHGF